jgi:hypothetical protein
MAAKRLLDYGCKIKYKKSFLIEPRQIKTPDDLRPGTRKGKLDRTPIWLVEIMMPKKLVEDIYEGYMSKLKENKFGRTNKVSASPAEPADSAVAGAPLPAPAAPAAPVPPGAPA